MEWGLEGYHLWMVTVSNESSWSQNSQANSDSVDGSFSDEFEKYGHSRSDEESDENKEERKSVSSSGHDSVCTQLIQFQFLKSALTVNPCMVRHDFMKS